MIDQSEWSIAQPYMISLQIENKHCKIMKMLLEKQVHEFRYLDIRALGNGSVSHLVELPEDEVSKLATRKARVDGNSAWIESDGCKTCLTMLSLGAFLVSGRTVEGSTIIYNLLAPSRDAYTKLFSALERKGLKIKVLRVEKLQRKSRTLTDTQRKALWLALRTGLFEYPKTTSPAEVARKLRIAPSTLSEILRRGTRRLLEDHFKLERGL